MAKVAPIVKETLKTLSKAELEKLVLKAATKNQDFADYLLANLAPDGLGLDELFDKTKEAIKALEYKNYKARSYEKSNYKKLNNQLKLISAFDKNCVDKNKVVDLLLMLVSNELDDDLISWNTWYTAYNNKVATILQKAITVASTKIHPDLFIDYKHILNNFIQSLKEKSSQLDKVYLMQLID
jgi:thioester reductase-like protein